MIRLTVDWPPSVNHLYRNRNGSRYMTPEGSAFEEKVAWKVRGLRAKTFEGPVRVVLDCTPPDRRRRDLDNVLKAVLDALTRGRLWKDDSQVKRIEATMRPALAPGMVEIAVAEWEGR